MLVKKLRMNINGNISYRIAYARGKDFYPRTDIAEQQSGSNGTRSVECNVGATIQPGGALHIRLFPWSVSGGRVSFALDGLSVEAVEIE